MKTRPPKLRFPPGTFVRLSDEPGKLWEVAWVYRMKENPNVWRYALKAKVDFNTSIQKGEQRVFWQPMASGLYGRRGVDSWSYDRVVSTPDMLKLAEIAIDDIMEA